MKSLLFKTAWKIAKESKVSFGTALKAAWAAIKNDAKVFVTTSWNGIKNIAFQKDGCQSNTIERVLEMIASKKSITNNGARFDYGVGAYNGD